jgi:hypothetical protein
MLRQGVAPSLSLREERTGRELERGALLRTNSDLRCFYSLAKLKTETDKCWPPLPDPTAIDLGELLVGRTLKLWCYQQLVFGTPRALP